MWHCQSCVVFVICMQYLDLLHTHDTLQHLINRQHKQDSFKFSRFSINGSLYIADIKPIATSSVSRSIPCWYMNTGQKLNLVSVVLIFSNTIN